MDYKLVCWGDVALPVPERATHLAWDADGAVYWYFDEPKKYVGDAWVMGHEPYGIACSAKAKLPPPLGGPWYNQVYDIT